MDTPTRKGTPRENQQLHKTDLKPIIIGLVKCQTNLDIDE